MRVRIPLIEAAARCPLGTTVLGNGSEDLCLADSPREAPGAAGRGGSTYLDG